MGNSFRIEVLGSIRIVHTEMKQYTYKRKGYFVGKRWVKPKKFLKFKRTRIKNPYLSGDINLKVWAKFIIGGVYMDENGKKYMCIRRMSIEENLSWLRVVSTNLGESYEAPKILTLIMQQLGETCK